MKLSTPGISLALLFATTVAPACNFADKYCIGDCPEPNDTDGEVSSASASETGQQDTGDSPVTTTDPLPASCEIVDDYVAPATCMNDITEPGEICFMVGFGNRGFANGLVSAIATPLDGAGGTDLLVTHDDDTLTALLFSPGPALINLSSQPWPGPFADGALQLTAIGDFNEDGFPDVAGRREGATEDAIQILLLDGEGGLLSMQTVMTGVGLVGPDLFDEDQDGHLDLLVTRPFDDDDSLDFNVMPLRGDGNGGFTSDAHFGYSEADLPHVTGALDPDGLLNDIVFFTDESLDFLHRFMGEELSAFLYAPDDVVIAVAIVDVQGDGRGDIVTLVTDTVTATSAIVVYTQSGPFDPNLVFTSARYPVHCEATALRVGDIDGDGFPEIATAGAGTPLAPITVRINDGQGGFASVLTLQAEGPIDDLFFVDLNADGATDLLTVNRQNALINMAPATP